MCALSTTGEAVRTERSLTALPRTERRWDLAFLSILGYVVVEYTRLPAMYPILIPLRLGKVVVAASLVGLLLAPRARQASVPQVRRIDVATVALLLAGFFSAMFAPFQELAWDGLLDAVRMGLIYFLIGRIVNTSWRLKVFVFLLLLLNFKLAQHGIRYYFSGVKIYGETVALREGAAAGSVGFFSDSADFGNAMCVVWPLATSLLFAERKKLVRWLFVLFSATFLFAIFICGSRGAVVGAAAIVLTALSRNPKRFVTVVLASGFLIALLYVLPQASKRRFESAWHWQNDPTASNRVYLWKAGLMIWRDHPFLGVGIDNFPWVRANSYAIPGSGGSNPFGEHSIFIQALSGLGLVGTIPFLLLMVFQLRLNARTRKQLLALDPRYRRSWEYSLAQGLDLAMVGFAVSGAFISVLFYPQLWVLSGMSVGLNTACRQLQPDKQALQLQQKRLQLVPVAS